MRKRLTLLLALCLLQYIGFSQLTVRNLVVENLTNPIGLDVQDPRFGWQLVSDQRYTVQSAYEIKMSSGATSVWNTGKVNSDQSSFVDYGGPALQSGKRYQWQVRVWDNHGKASAWSQPAFFQEGFLKGSDWKASWIQPQTEDSVLRPCPLFRKKFQIDKKVKSATAYITAHGLYEAFMNGQRVGNAYLSPGWTSYNKRLQYQVYDVTDLIKNGVNAIAVMLGDGWYRGYIGFSGQKNFYGKDISLLMQVNIVFQDGSTDSVITNQNWKSSTGSVRSSDIYNGETVDNREEKKGWTQTEYNDDNWAGVRVASYGMDHLVATYNEPIRKHETFKPKRIFTTPKGEKVIDFGQNLVGWVQVKAKGHAGDKIIISHAEVLDKEGNFYVENLRACKSIR